MVCKDDDDEENETDAFAMEQMKSWVPEPVNADLKHTAKAQRMQDIISMLVHIYGSKDLFINEYRCLKLCPLQRLGYTPVCPAVSRCEVQGSACRKRKALKAARDAS